MTNKPRRPTGPGTRWTACVLAVVLGVSMASWRTITGAGAASGLSSADKRTLTKVSADIEWPRPKPGSWKLEYERQIGGLPPVIKKVSTQDKVVFITIDDGWTHDPGFVDIVRKQRIPVMVFLTDQAAKPSYRYFWTLQRAGAPIENHTVDHAAPSNDMRRLSAEQQKRQICDSSANFAQQYGRRPQIFRPPGGSYDQATLTAARDCGIKSVLLWSVEHYNGMSGLLKRSDSTGTQPQPQPPGSPAAFQPGDVILLHFRQNLAADFAKLLGWIRQQGFRPAAIQNYLPRSLGGNAPG